VTLPEAARVEIWNQRLAAVADEMGAVLRRVAISPNIRERADYSCAIFDAEGRLVADAPHVPVHLGSMGRAVRAVMAEVALIPGVVAIVNDPFRGGTHLPDLTLVAAVHLPAPLGGGLLGHVACRAHHADIGGASPGSMPMGTRALPGEVPEEPDTPPAVGPRYDAPAPTGVERRAVTIADEGVRLGPQVLDEALLARLTSATRSPDERRADLFAQLAALRAGQGALAALAAAHGAEHVRAAFADLYAYGSRLMRESLARLPAGIYPFADSLDDDGAGRRDLALRVVLILDGDRAVVDLSESCDETEGSLNAVRAVTEAAVAYVFRLLLPTDAPTNEGSLSPIEIVTRPGSIVDAQPPRAVAAGNVETSQRIVDLLLGALARACPDRVPAASAGTMSNLIVGDDQGAYYETIGGGAGGGPRGAGASAIQTHMTNTRNTPVEVLEASAPLQVVRYAIRRGSGGGGSSRGGDGIVRELELTAPQTITLVGDRRRRPPYGLAGGGPGTPGRDTLTRDGVEHRLPSKIVLEGRTGDRLRIETPGGGGHGDVRRAKMWAAVLSGAAIAREDLDG
jgi:N-methylhydantoinase B